MTAQLITLALVFAAAINVVAITAAVARLKEMKL